MDMDVDEVALALGAFHGGRGAVTLRDSYNVSSVTYNATATKTDPDAVSVICFGQLS